MPSAGGGEEERERVRERRCSWLESRRWAVWRGGRDWVVLRKWDAIEMAEVGEEEVVV